MLKILHINTNDTGGAANACLRWHNGPMQIEEVKSKVLVRYKKLDIKNTSTAVIQNPSKLCRTFRLNRYELGVCKHSIKSKRELEKEQIVKPHFKNLEFFSFPYIDLDITENDLFREADIIHLHWVVYLLDFESFFKKNIKPLVLTPHDMQPFKSGLHYDKLITGINQDGYLTLRALNQEDAKKIIPECHRVLKPGGIIRIAVPDLEQIVKQYLMKLKESMEGNTQSQHDYDWIMLELFDQTVRNSSGGEMAKYLFQDHIPNEKYVMERVGQEAQDLRDLYLKSKQNSPNFTNFKASPLSFLSINNYLNKLKQPKQAEKENTALKIGNFRLDGEVHQWMYDRYSPKKLLISAAFSNYEVKSFTTSEIPNWLNFELEVKNGVIYKPHSLFVEANINI
jgi:SAM-dependent methyltransferase